MLLQLGLRRVQIGQGRAGQFHLPAGLERNGRFAAHEADQVVTLHHRLPAIDDHAFQEVPQPVGLAVTSGPQIVEMIGEFFMLDADAPLRRRFHGIGEISDQLIAAGDRLGRAAGEDGHGISARRQGW